MYYQLKGETERDLEKMVGDFDNITILRPGLITDRNNNSDSRWGEKLAAYVPFIAKVPALSIAKFALNLNTHLFKNGIKTGFKTYENKRLVKFDKI